jgi:hypothetical protein
MSGTRATRREPDILEDLDLDGLAAIAESLPRPHAWAHGIDNICAYQARQIAFEFPRRAGAAEAVLALADRRSDRRHRASMTRYRWPCSNRMPAGRLPQRLQGDLRLQRRVDLPSRLLHHPLRLSRRNGPRFN